MTEALAIVLMGVSGCGKTSVGTGLSDVLGWPFFDGDDYHPQANVDKMSVGIPLTDEDRFPWLQNLHNLIVEHLSNESPLIVACSALKAEYRRILEGENRNVRFVFLEGSFDLIYKRMQQRSGHYMKADMLRSQFEALEPPGDAITVSIEKPVSIVVDEIMKAIMKQE